MNFQEYLGNCTEHLWLFCSILLYYPKQCLHLFRIHFALCSTARNHIVINLIIQKWQRMSEIFIKCWSQWHKSKSAIHEEKIEFYDITFLQETCKDQVQYYWLGKKGIHNFLVKFFLVKPTIYNKCKNSQWLVCLCDQCAFCDYIIWLSFSLVLQWLNKWTHLQLLGSMYEN